MAPLDFARLPHGAVPTLEATPFTVHVADDALEEMKALIKLSKLCSPIYEGEQDDRKYGVTNKWMREAKEHWLSEFDWRAKEADINRFPHFKIGVSHNGRPFSIHFAALFSTKKEAATLVLLHGWPGSFLEFLPMLGLLAQKYTPDTLPYHVIVPSLPGYAFSSRQSKEANFTLQEASDLINDAVIGLGLGKEYFVQGGDIGSYVSRMLAVKYPHVKAAHLNFCFYREAPPGFDEAGLTDWEAQGLAKTRTTTATGLAYAMEHATRPSTIAYTLAASPISLLAWIGEKLLEWTDEDPSIDRILELVSLYWLTETFPTSIYSYRQNTKEHQRGHDEPTLYIKKPTGYSWFPKEMAPVPKRYVEATANVTWFRKHDSGGHFAAMEKPDVLLKDIEDFIEHVQASS